MPVDLPALFAASLEELRERAQRLALPVSAGARKSDIIFALAVREGERDQQIFGQGVLEVHGEGFGFLRSAASNFLPGNDDIYVSQTQIRRFKLQTGDTVIGLVRAPKEGERYPAMLRVEAVNGEAPGQDRAGFDTLTAIYPDEHLQPDPHPLLSPIDLVAPLGLGQRGILVAPPRTGRVEILRSLADFFTQEEDLQVTVLLLGERPEEIHEWRKETRAEVIATPFDEPPARHVQVADIVFERARRMVERGDDAVLLVDSLSRLLRFCLAEIAPTGRDVGGVDTAALHRIRRYLGAARALEEGGSLTILGVLSGDPESRTDRTLLDDLRDVVNWELYLSRDVADRGIRPPLDVHRSGTRREERLIANPDERARREAFRASLSGQPLADAEAVIAACSVRASGPRRADQHTP